MEFAVFGKSTRIAPSRQHVKYRARSKCDQTLHHFDFPTLSLHRVNYHTLYTHSRLHPTSDGGNRNAMPTRFRCVRLACTICHVRDDRRFVGLSLATILLGYEALVAWRLASDYACARHLNAPGAVRLNTPGKRLAPCARTAPWLCAPTEWVRPGSYPSAQSPDYRSDLCRRNHLITSDLCRRNHLITSDLCRRNHLITSDLCRRRRAFKSGTASVHAANCSTGKTRSFKSVTARACAVRGRRSSKAASPKAGSPPGVAAAPPTAGTGPNVASNCRPRVSCTAPCRHPGRHRGGHSERPSEVVIGRHSEVILR